MKSSNILEKDIEAYLVRQTERVLSGKAPKYSSPGRRSVPDRLVMWSPLHVVFVECKRPGKTWTPAQGRERDKLIALGQLVFLVDTKEAVDKLLQNLLLL